MRCFVSSVLLILLLLVLCGVSDCAYIESMLVMCFVSMNQSSASSCISCIIFVTSFKGMYDCVPYQPFRFFYIIFFVIAVCCFSREWRVLSCLSCWSRPFSLRKWLLQSSCHWGDGQMGCTNDILDGRY